MSEFSPKHYFRPETASEASQTLARYKDRSIVIGGGTVIYELAQRGLLSDVEALVDLTRLSLDQVKDGEKFLSIGANVSLSYLQESAALREGRLACIGDALKEIRPIQVKNLATVGGAVSSCIPFFDLPVALASVGANVELNGPHAVRSVPILEFQRDFLQPDLREGEFVSAVLIPRQMASRASAFSKFALTGDDWATVNCACSLEIAKGIIREARIVFGAIASKPLLAERCGAALMNRRAEAAVIPKAIETLDGELGEPISDHRASSSYRKRVAKLLLQTTLERAFERGGG